MSGGERLAGGQEGAPGDVEAGDAGVTELEVEVDAHGEVVAWSGDDVVTIAGRAAGGAAVRRGDEGGESLGLGGWARARSAWLGGDLDGLELEGGDFEDADGEEVDHPREAGGLEAMVGVRAGGALAGEGHEEVAGRGVERQGGGAGGALGDEGEAGAEHERGVVGLDDDVEDVEVVEGHGQEVAVAGLKAAGGMTSSSTRGRASRDEGGEGVAAMFFSREVEEAGEGAAFGRRGGPGLAHAAAVASARQAARWRGDMRADHITAVVRFVAVVASTGHRRRIRQRPPRCSVAA